MAIARTSMVDDDGSGTTGTVFNNAWKQELYNQIDGIGTWTAVPFSAANFGAVAPMTWTVATGHVLVNRYTVIGKTLLWCVYIFGSATGGSPSPQLHCILPGGFTASHVRSTTPLSYLADTIGYATGFSESIGGFYLGVNKTNAANYGIGTVHLAFTATVELV